MIKNKTIVIDPGHGGEALGAVGPNGLMEKDVNFRVAKFLAKKLQDAGAIVYMTRDGDYDVPLADRVEFAKSRKADAFVSIHHNANARRDPRINRSEIYCVFDPLSPSFDLGHLLYSKFREKLGLPILPPLLARYRVLKGNVDVAVLGEASYISNPEEEKRLADPNYNELEAEAYFEAIREYFERGVPKIVDFELKLRQNKAFARIEDPEGPGVDAGFVSVFLDGEAIDFDFEPLTGKLTVRLPELLPNGEHKLLLYARNRYGNITPKLEHTFTIKRPIVSFSLTTYPESGRNPVLLIVRLFDRYGMPIGEGERVNIRVPSGKILAIQPHADKNGVVRAVVMFSESESKVGIEVENFGGQTFRITAIPAVLSPGEAEGAVRECIEKKLETGQNAPMDRVIDKFLAVLACHSAVRSGQELTIAQMREILRGLDRVQGAGSCPHGRPTFWAVPLLEIEKRFKRR